MDKDKKIQTIKFYTAIIIMAIILIFVAVVIIKYQVEGEKNMPFNLSKIIVISTAEGVEKEDKKEDWNFDIFQNNDIYLYIDKNMEYNSNTETYISSVTIENIRISEPNTGEIKAYMPNSLEGRLYNYSDDYIIDENLVYKGGSKSNSKTLEIGNQGGEVLIRFSNVNVGKYASSKDKQVVHDGTLIEKIGKTTDDIRFNVKFDLIIKTNRTKYKAELSFDLPNGDLTKEGRTILEINETDNIIFKRVR